MDDNSGKNDTTPQGRNRQGPIRDEKGRFPKGVSGCPGGLSPGRVKLRDIMSDVLINTKHKTIHGKNVNAATAMVLNLVEIACDPDITNRREAIAASKLIIERVEGQLPQLVEHSGTIGPVLIAYTDSPEGACADSDD